MNISLYDTRVTINIHKTPSGGNHSHHQCCVASYKAKKHNSFDYTKYAKYAKW